VDAVLLVVAGDSLSASVDLAITQAVGRAIDQGDFAFKAGRLAYLGAVPGLKAPRLAVACAARATPKALKAAFTAALAQLKSQAWQSHSRSSRTTPPAQSSHSRALRQASAASSVT
jgi:leucyl aminopeptidase